MKTLKESIAMCSKSIILPLVLISALFFCKQPAKTQQIITKKNLHDTITVAFYNAENLFDATYDGGEYAEYNPATSNWNQDIFSKKLSNTADVIAAINAEIIGLCEVENAQALKALQQELIKKGYLYKYSAIGDFPLKANTCVALLSKLPVKKTNSIEVRLKDGSITRNILEVDIGTRTSIIKIFVNHWPSLGHPEETRISAATVLSKRLSELSPKTEYLLIGDFNSNYNECEKKDKLHKNSLSITGFNNHLKTIHKTSTEIAQYTSEHDMIDGAPGHYDLWFELPLASRMSGVFNGHNQTLDHILLPPSLFDNTGFSYIDNSFSTFTWNGKLLKGNVPFRWQFQRNGIRKDHTGEGYSDHLPLIARFHRGAFVDIVENEQPEAAIDGFAKKNPPQLSSTIIAPQKWTSCNNTVTLTTTTGTDQKQYFHIKSSPSSSNISVARRSMTMTNNLLMFNLKGSGKVCIRIRTTDSGWIYFNAPEYKGTKTARYSEVIYPDWKKVRLDLKKLGNMDQIEIEIRAGKNSPFDFEFSEIAL
jgi:endonuclease/exonuclease/phosphatase family metal-dependent hydrolase